MAQKKFSPSLPSLVSLDEFAILCEKGLNQATSSDFKSAYETFVLLKKSSQDELTASLSKPFAPLCEHAIPVCTEIAFAECLREVGKLHEAEFELKKVKV